MLQNTRILTGNAAPLYSRHSTNLSWLLTRIGKTYQQNRTHNRKVTVRESENRGIRVNIGGSAQSRTNILDESQDTARQQTQLTASRNITFGTVPAREVVRTIRTLTGQDDINVEDFIRLVEKEQENCSQPDLLLDFILAEKITQIAERAIRLKHFDSFGF